jgi:hypothetical protein
MKDIEETKSGKVGSGVLNVGLPAYVIINALLRSAKANSVGIILSKFTGEQNSLPTECMLGPDLVLTCSGNM